MSALDIVISDDGNTANTKLLMVGFKVPLELKLLLEARAKDRSTTVSNLVRSIVEESFLTDRLQAVVVNNVKKGVALILSITDIFDWNSAREFVDKIFNDSNDQWPPSAGMAVAAS